MEYVSLDTPIDGTGVLASYTNQFKPAKEPAKKPVNQTLRRSIQKESKYAAPKKVLFSE